MLAGPLFVVLVVVNSLASLDWLHSLGWELVGGEELPYPSCLALGPHGWLQVANYLATGTLLLVFAVYFRRQLRGVVGLIGGALTVAFAATVILTALRIDRSMIASSDPEQWNGYVHAFGALVGLLCALVAMLFVGLALRRDPAMRLQARLSFVGPLAVIAAGFTPLGLAASLLVVLAWYVVLGVGVYRSDVAALAAA